MQKIAVALVCALLLGLLTATSASSAPSRDAAHDPTPSMRCVEDDGSPCKTAKKKARDFRHGKLGRTIHKHWPPKTRRKIVAAFRRAHYINPRLFDGEAKTPRELHRMDPWDYFEAFKGVSEERCKRPNTPTSLAGRVSDDREAAGHEHIE